MSHEIGAKAMPKTAAEKSAQDKWRKGRYVSVVMPKELAAQFNEMAQDTGKTKAALAMAAIEAYLSSPADTVTATPPAPKPVSDTAIELFSKAYRTIQESNDSAIGKGALIDILEPLARVLYNSPHQYQPLKPTAESQPPPPVEQDAETPPAPMPETELRATELREALARGIDNYKPVFFSEVQRLQNAGVGFKAIAKSLNAADLSTQTGSKPVSHGNLAKALTRWNQQQKTA